MCLFECQIWANQKVCLNNYLQSFVASCRGSLSSRFSDEVFVVVPCSLPHAIAKVVKWYKKEGDLVKYNDMLCDIETEVSIPFMLPVYAVGFVDDALLSCRASWPFLFVSHRSLRLVC
jgi:hypothetical protein